MLRKCSRRERRLAWRRRAATAAVVALGLVRGAGAGEVPDTANEVREAERAFARTMADRDHIAFASYVSEEAVFLGAEVLRGRDSVAEGWKPFFEAERAPFSWEPERVVVLESGDLALSTGPVFDPEGKRVGTFNSTWRREADGRWRVVFDVGCPPCRD
jgi:ketosteroid isomerase-like protein